MKPAALITGKNTHLLDHLAPVAEAMDAPLILTDQEMVSIAHTFYPETRCIVQPESSLLSFIAEHFDLLFISVITWTKELQFLFHSVYQKKMRIVYCSHGNSDKGQLAPLLHPYKDQDIALVYGKQMADRLEKENLMPKILLQTGNMRLSFYLRRKEFYDRLIEKMVFSRLNPSNQTILYAPTWKDAEDSGTFFELCPWLAEKKPAHYNLIIKLHPLLEERHPGHTLHLMGSCENIPNLLFLTHFPVVYPLLERCDLFLGDFSAVGYDFLFFDRPMYFFQKDTQKENPSFLHQCGTRIDQKEKIYPVIEKTHLKSHSKKRQQLYRYAFGEETGWRQELSRIVNDEGRKNPDGC